jgi:hypothetical protein
MSVAQQLPEVPPQAVLNSVTVQLTSAQILAINTTPVIIVPTPGPGKIICFVHGFINTKPGTILYNSPGGHFVFVLNTLSQLASTTMNDSMIGNSNEEVNFATAQNQNSPALLSSTASNQPLCLTDDTGNPTTGNGTMIVTVQFYIANIL